MRQKIRRVKEQNNSKEEEREKEDRRWSRCSGIGSLTVDMNWRFKKKWEAKEKETLEGKRAQSIRHGICYNPYNPGLCKKLGHVIVF